MAVRGVLTTIDVYPANYDITTLPLYSFQNHFPGNRTIGSITYAYNSFRVSPSFMGRDAAPQDMSIDFVATASNVDLVESALINRYEIAVVTYRWSSANGIDNPADYNIFSFYSGDAISGSADVSTVTLQINSYSTSLNTDIPWRKIPWTILGPLSFRR